MRHDLTRFAGLGQTQRAGYRDHRTIIGAKLHSWVINGAGKTFRNLFAEQLVRANTAGDDNAIQSCSGGSLD